MHKNKRGIALPEVLKVILAVLVILLLVLLASKLYGIFTNTTRIQQAQANMDDIIAKMKSLKAGTSTDYVLLSPAGYVLVGWPLPDDTILPDSCIKSGWSNCLCMCEYAGQYTPSYEQGLLISMGFALVEDIASAPVGAYNYVIGLKTYLKIKQELLAACTGNGVYVCKGIDGKITTQSLSLYPNSKTQLIGNLIKQKPNEAIAQLAERPILLRVDELLDQKRILNITLTDTGYLIIPSGASR